jgi:regulator of ribonuclease activity B
MLLGMGEQFTAFYPVRDAVRSGHVAIAFRVDIPERWRRFPTFRNSVAPDGRGRDYDWWLWDEGREWLVGRLTEEQEQLPRLQWVTDLWLIEHICSGYEPIDDFVPRPERVLDPGTAAKLESLRASVEPGPGVPRATHHFLYFVRKVDAQSVARHARAAGLIPELLKHDNPDDRFNWAVIVSDLRMESLQETEKLLTTLAEEQNGEYEGNEFPV